MKMDSDVDDTGKYVVRIHGSQDEIPQGRDGQVFSESFDTFEEAANDADFARIYQSQRTFREDYSHWKSRAYLPRDF